MNDQNVQNVQNVQNDQNVQTKKKFNIKAQKFSLTYDYVQIPFIEGETFFKGFGAYKKLLIAHEVGKETGMLHTHVAVWYVKVIHTTNEAFFDYNGYHPNIQKTEKWEAWVTYCIKDGNFKANFEVGQVNIVSLIDRVVGAKSAVEAVKENAKTLRDVVPIIQIYNNKGYTMDEDLLKELTNAQFKGWQQTLYDKLSNENNSRKIFWVHEPVGGVGKTYFCDMLEAKHMHEYLVIAATGSLRDIADVIRNWMDGGNLPKTILIDMPRTFEDRDSIYTVLESLKNGRLTCTKYKGATLRFRSPAVCVFSNWKPHTDKCSKDRWDISTIINDALVPAMLGEPDGRKIWEADDE